MGEKGTLIITSFGFKHGVPSGPVDLLVNLRLLRNPYRNRALRQLTGLDQRVQDDVMGYPPARILLESIQDMIHLQLDQEMHVHLGCYAGHHRSVVFAEILGTWAKTCGFEVVVQHRDLGR